MAVIKWEKSYNLGIKEIDLQHQGLVVLLNNLHDAMLENKAQDVLVSIIGELVKYTVVHFGTEEKYFTKFSYSEREEHIQEHKDFVMKVKDFAMDYEKGRVMLSIDIINFLREWLIDHILGTDSKYAEFFKSKGLS
ncbi:MAG: hemerythrin family protein [Candidatus Marinimicrobia bacterium]|nr:hemerythrin family protein [Candidatus Neomarinimicrobiota bacterium]